MNGKTTIRQDMPSEPHDVCVDHVADDSHDQHTCFESCDSLFARETVNDADRQLKILSDICGERRLKRFGCVMLLIMIVFPCVISLLFVLLNILGK